MESEEMLISPQQRIAITIILVRWLICKILNSSTTYGTSI